MHSKISVFERQCLRFPFRNPHQGIVRIDTIQSGFRDLRITHHELIRICKISSDRVQKSLDTDALAEIKHIIDKYYNMKLITTRILCSIASLTYSQWLVNVKANIWISIIEYTIQFTTFYKHTLWRCMWYYLHSS